MANFAIKQGVIDHHHFKFDFDIVGPFWELKQVDGRQLPTEVQIKKQQVYTEATRQLDDYMFKEMRTTPIETLARELLSFAKNQRTSDNERVMISTLTGSFWYSKKIAFQNAPLDVQNIMRQTEVEAQKNSRYKTRKSTRARMEKGKEELPILVEACVKYSGPIKLDTETGRLKVYNYGHAQTIYDHLQDPSCS